MQHMDGFILFGLLVYWEEKLVSSLAQEANTLYLKLNKICLTHHLLWLPLLWIMYYD